MATTRSTPNKLKIESACPPRRKTASVTTTETATTPGLHDLLAAPATDLLPGHAADAATTVAAGHATAAHAHEAAAHALHGLTNNRLLDEEQNRANPLI